MGNNFLLDRRWYEHLAPREFCPHFEHFDYMFREYLGRYKRPALQWDIAGMAGVPVRVKVGDPEPVFHFIAMLTPTGWRRFPIPPEKQQSIRHDARGSGGGRSIGISATGELPIAPSFRLEIVTDPYLVEMTNRTAQSMSAANDGTGASFEQSRVKTPSLIFSINVEHLVTNQRVHGKFSRPPRYVLYQHMFGDGSEYPMNGPFYIGITQRDWKKRWGEHRAAINRGSPLKFHRIFRERKESGRLTHIHHKVMAAVNDLKLLYALEEEMVDGHWEDQRLLNMIPGGEKGIRYLHEHRILDRKVRPMPDQMDRILETWIRDHPRKGLPAPWVAEKWKDDEWATKMICGQERRLSIEQVRAIRKLAKRGLSYEAITENVGAANVLQVERVVEGKTYIRVR